MCRMLHVGMFVQGFPTIMRGGLYPFLIQFFASLSARLSRAMAKCAIVLAGGQFSCPTGAMHHTHSGKRW